MERPIDQQIVQYGNLSPGSYRFEVRSIGETGLMSAPAVFEFRLLPPFWRRSWFAAVAAYCWRHRPPDCIAIA